MNDKIPTTERLARALKATNDPKLAQMIERAKAGYYDDYKSPLANPISQLIDDLRSLGHEELAKQAIDDEFSATPDESSEWFAREGCYLVSGEVVQALLSKKPNPKGFEG